MLTGRRTIGRFDRHAEVIMVLVGIVLRLLWHVMQLRGENEEFKAVLAKYGSAELVKKALDKHI